MTTRKWLSLFILALSLLLPLSGILALGNEERAEIQYGMGIVGLVWNKKHDFVGGGGRMEIPITETIGILTEVGVTNGIRGNDKDNDIEFIDGVLRGAFTLGKMKMYIGIGTGYYRHSERPGGAVWTKYGFYSTLAGGIETETFFAQGKTTTSKMNPVISIGVFF